MNASQNTIKGAISSKRRIKALQVDRNKERIKNITTQNSYKARVIMDLNNMSFLFDRGVNRIVMSVDEDTMAMFTELIYSDVLADYDIQQEGSSNEFSVGRNFIKY
jgi:hypothetical protein